MSSLHARPLFWLSVAFVLGIVLGREAPRTAPLNLLLAASTLGLFCLVLGIPDRLKALRSHFIGLSTFCLFGLVASFLAAPVLPAPSSLMACFKTPATLYLAEIASPPVFQSEKSRIQVHLHSSIQAGRLRPIRADILLNIGQTPEESSRWLPGDRFLARLDVRPLRGFQNPGGFDYARYQAEKGIHGRAYVPDDRSLVRVREPVQKGWDRLLPQPGIMAFFETFRQECRLWLGMNLPEDVADFYGTLLLGYPLPSRWNDHLNRTGLTHLLSISGLHLGLVSLGVFWLTCLVVRWVIPWILQRTSDQQIARWPALGAAAAYALLSGLALPTWRSLIMLGLFTWAVLRHRSPDAMTTLACAAMGILLAWPNSIAQVSFQLSFGAMIGLFVVYPRIHGLIFLNDRVPSIPNRLIASLLRPFAEAFWVSLAVNAMVLPILIHHFHGISVAGFLANTLLVPLVGFIVLPLGLVGLILLPLQDTLALWVFQAGGWVLEGCLWAILQFSNLSWAYFWVGTVSAGTVVAWYGGLLLLQSRFPWRYRAGGLVALCLLAMSLEVLPLSAGTGLGEPSLRVNIIDVGQGSSTLLRFPNGETMLVDGGGFHDDSFDVGRAVLAPFLWHLGIRRLDHVVLTHDHPDHRNGLKFVLSHFTVGTYWENGIPESPSRPGELAAIAARRRIPIARLPELRKEPIIGACRVSILHPTPNYLKHSWDGRDLNNTSIVLLVNFGKTRVLLPGDIDQSVEALLPADTFPAEGTLLIAPHHGSERSSGPALLDRSRPQAVVFSCGRDNLFGFPSELVLARCRQRSIPVYRTDLDGALEAVSNGTRWEIRPLVPANQ
jgi:competence protein ComEC